MKIRILLVYHRSTAIVLIFLLSKAYSLDTFVHSVLRVSFFLNVIPFLAELGYLLIVKFIPTHEFVQYFILSIGLSPPRIILNELIFLNVHQPS